MTDAATRDGSLRVTSRRKLCESPLALVPLSDRPEGPVIVLGHGDSWLARRSPGCQRMSVVRLDAPPGIAPATKFSPPVSDPSRRSRGESALAVVDGRLALVSPDLEQSDAASRCDADARLGEDGRVSNVKFLCQDIATGRAVTVTPYWVPHEDDENDPAKSDDDDAHTVWEIRAWPPSSRPPEEAEDDDTAASLASDYVLDARPSPRFRVTALASCHPPKGVIGGIIAVGTSQLPVTYKRRQHGPPEPEGRLFIFRLVDNDDERNPCGPCLAQAACIALPSPATCVATAGPGVLFAGSGNRVYCIRIGPRDDDDDVPARIPDDVRELGPGDPRFDAAYLSQSLSVTLVAQTTARRGVTALAVGPPLLRSNGFVGRARGHYPMLGGEADVSEEEGYVPVAIAGARESVALSVLKTVDTDAASRLAYPEFTPIATDATVRTVRAMAMRRRGEVAGVDASGRIFVLQNRNAPAKKRSADEPEDENNGNGNGNGRRKHGPCSPETNFTIAASFTLRSSPRRRCSCCRTVRRRTRNRRSRPTPARASTGSPPPSPSGVPSSSARRKAACTWWLRSRNATGRCCARFSPSPGVTRSRRRCSGRRTKTLAGRGRRGSASVPRVHPRRCGRPWPRLAAGRRALGRRRGFPRPR